jgi:hypothetical protein
MNATRDHRYNQRTYQKASVIIEDFGTGYQFGGTMLNCSADGMYLETDYALRRRRKIRIQLNNRPADSASRVYLAEVRWRRLVSGNGSSYAYGIGVRYCSPQ